MGALAAAGRKRRGFKEGGLAHGEITARGFVNSAVLPFRIHIFLNRCADVPRGEVGGGRLETKRS